GHGLLLGRFVRLGPGLPPGLLGRRVMGEVALEVAHLRGKPGRHLLVVGRKRLQAGRAVSRGLVLAVVATLLAVELEEVDGEPRRDELDLAGGEDPFLPVPVEAYLAPDGGEGDGPPPTKQVLEVP